MNDRKRKRVKIMPVKRKSGNIERHSSGVKRSLAKKRHSRSATRLAAGQIVIDAPPFI